MVAWQGWLVVIVMAVGTFAIRFSVLGAMGDRTFSPWVQRVLNMVLPAMFAGIAAPMLLLSDGAVDVQQNLPKVIAAGTSLFIAMRWGGYLTPLVAGMIVLHTAQWMLRLPG